MRINSRAIAVVAYIFIALGIFNVVYERVERYEMSISFDRDVLQSNVAILAVGLVALMVAVSLKALENCLHRLEITRIEQGGIGPSDSRTNVS